MSGFGALLSYEFKAGLRNRTLLLMNYLFPLGFYVMMGVVMTGINPGFRETIVPAMALFAVLSGLILGLPNPLVEHRETGVLRSYRVSGIRALAVLLSPALTTSLHAVIVAIVIAVTAPPLFGGVAVVNWGWFGLAVMATVIAHAGIGALLGVVSSDQRTTVLWSQLIYLPSLLIGGVMLPSELLPDALQTAGRLLPSTYAMKVFLRAIGPGGDEAALAALTLAASGGLAFGLAAWLFRWDGNVRFRRSPWLAVLALLPYGLWLLNR